jgi:hypothetical protein
MNIRAGLAFVALCAVWLTAPSFAAPRGSKIAAVEAAPNAAYVTAHYLTALAKLKHAKTVSFEYALEQLGLHTMEQTHRVYRSGSNERDETLVIDGIKLNAPAVRIITGRNPHYDIAVVTPRPETYRFTPVAAPKTSTGVYTYVFHVAPRAPRAFAVTAIELDGRTYLRPRQAALAGRACYVTVASTAIGSCAKPPFPRCFRTAKPRGNASRGRDIGFPLRCRAIRSACRGRKHRRRSCRTP